MYIWVCEYCFKTNFLTYPFKIYFPGVKNAKKILCNVSFAYNKNHTSSTKCCSVVSVTSITLIEIGILPNAAMLLLLSRVLFLVVTMAYYYHLGRKPKKIWTWLCDTSREGTAEHRSQMWGQKVWNIIWLGLGALLYQGMPPAPFHGTWPIVTPSIQQMSTVSRSRLYNNEKPHSESELLFHWPVR